MSPTLDSLRSLGAELNAKRRPRVGLDAWYPYYAGFSEAFARSVLSKAGLARGATVMDPWNGSGTTTHVADQLGFSAIGFDINPVAALVANAKLARARDAEHASGLARRIVASTTNDDSNQACTDALTGWLHPTVVRQYRRIEAAIISDLATDTSAQPLALRDGGTPPLASFLLLALLRAARAMAALKTSTNPTWIKPEKPHTGSAQILGSRWLDYVQRMATDLALDAAATGTRSGAIVADARALPMADASVDFVLTSPPYCTRIDYVISTSFELAALGLARTDDSFVDLRKRCMGAPIIRSDDIADPRPSWPDSLRRLLTRIRKHKSRDSSSYYYKTYWQYFDDCDRSLQELRRVMQPGAMAVLVVQTSYYKDVRIALPQLYVSIGEALGFRAAVVGSTNVQHSLTQINSRSLRHRETTRYQEAVVALEKVT